MGSYFFAEINITNREEYRKYEQSFSAVFAPYNGEIMVSDEKPVQLEGLWSSSRIVLIPFPNKEDLQRWYYSAEYQEIIKLRKNASTGNVMILKISQTQLKVMRQK